LFDATGTQGATFGDSSTALNTAPVIWDGTESADQFLSPYNNNPLLGNLYQVNGQWYASGLGRTLSQSTVTAGSTNPYIINGNDPFAKRQASFDWSTIEGPGAFNAYGAFGYGAWTVASFGTFDYFNNSYGAIDEAATNGYFWGGMAFGIASQLYMGNVFGVAAGGGAGVTNASRALYATSRAYQGYMIAGDVIGVGQSGYNIAAGKFSAMDTLGFLPTIGWASSAFRRARTFAPTSASQSFINNSARPQTRPYEFRGLNHFKDRWIRREMSQTEAGRRVLQAADAGEINLVFDNGVPGTVKAPPKDLYGELFQFGQDIPEARVYLWNNQNGRLYEEIGVRASGYETVAGTAIHEGLHGLGIGDSRRAEALVRLAELGLLGRRSSHAPSLARHEGFWRLQKSAVAYSRFVVELPRIGVVDVVLAQFTR
jgi:hypothetical protein